MAEETPRGIMFALLAITSTVFALVNVVPWNVTFGIFGLLVPLGIWYYLAMRTRPKRRAVLSHSGAYMAYVMLLMLALQGSRFWEALTWWEVGSKWLLMFAVGWFAIARMRAATIKNRLKDASERPV